MLLSTELHIQMKKKNKISSRDQLFSEAQNRIEKYREKSIKARKVINLGKDYTGKKEEFFPLSELEGGPVTDNSLVPWPVFAAIISRKDIQKIIIKKKKAISFKKGKIKVKHLLNKIFPTRVKDKRKHKKR